MIISSPRAVGSDRKEPSNSGFFRVGIIQRLDFARAVQTGGHGSAGPAAGRCRRDGLMGIGADERAYTHEGWPGRLARKSAAVGYRRPRRAVARTAAAGPPRVVCLLVAASGAPAWFQPAMWPVLAQRGAKPTDPPGARLDLVER
uniref:Uncharacterized protein n=1 Tax=Setaria italica TaxID=4555 RepID=K3XZT9_SETIT